MPGSLDLCFIVHGTIAELLVHLNAHDVKIEEGPVRRTDASGEIESVYLRDPDLNLIELSVYLNG
ncbi:hypothetical protein ACXJGY_23290 [Klebsiella quasipneumoniae subsp. similipneumoniae]|uniref:hypothetical protein n=1 Tax=Klebsiella quasipneumoniae TaxID=1463165 RepID=UPI0010351758|nr:hypothetical protein [Klebsiella quasipneumoniae]